MAELMNTELSTVPHQQFVAVTPTELIPAQRGVIDWFQRKIHALALELREQRNNLRQAKTMKWKHSGWVNAVARTKKRMVYYTKIKQALAAGYLIVPNFDVNVIAVRTARQMPKDETDVTEATPDILPPRQGRYVDNALIGYNEEREAKRHDGTKYTVSDFHPTAYDSDIDFPAALVKPSVMAATDRAMALRLFDRIGIVRKGRKSDPIVVGQIIDPQAPTAYGSLRSNPKCVTFFVAWYLDSRDL